MKKIILNNLLILIVFFTFQISSAQHFTKEDYTKKEVYIEMRDGVKLYTAIYSPKKTSEKYPMILSRTTWGSRPYGKDKMPRYITYNNSLLEEGYIFVHQDVRGRFMSEGEFDNTRPIISNENPDGVDELTDTYDTVEWLIHNVKNGMPKVGVVGTSYPGFYAALSAISGHPAIKAVSPQAPVSDLFFDDIHRNGTFGIYFWTSLDAIGIQTPNKTDKWWDMYNVAKIQNKDGYDFYLNDLGSLKNSEKYMNPENFFWKQIITHPNYDTFWQERNPLPHMKDINCQVLIVGGWNDMENLYGTLSFYNAIKAKSKNIKPYLVMGPWAHGDYRYEEEEYYIGNIYFGKNLSAYFQKNIEAPFFNYYLKQKGKEKDIPRVTLYDTGNLTWNHFEDYPEENENKITFYPKKNGELNTEINDAAAIKEGITYVSDPNAPIPYSSDRKLQVYSPKTFVTEDQRFVSSRPDVITFSTDVLQKDMLITGKIEAELKIATDQADADWIVKIIDVFPQEISDSLKRKEGVFMEGYEHIIRWDVIRGRFRNSFTTPEPFEPNKKTFINLNMLDLFHTFKKGHKIMIQIQNSYFPYLDRNPQKYVPNIYQAADEDFTKANHTIFLDSKFMFNAVEKNSQEKNNN